MQYIRVAPPDKLIAAGRPHGMQQIVDVLRRPIRAAFEFDGRQQDAVALVETDGIAAAFNTHGDKAAVLGNSYFRRSHTGSETQRISDSGIERPREHLVGTVAPIESKLGGTRTAIQKIGAATTLKFVSSIPAEQKIIAVAAQEQVISRFAIQTVVARQAEDPVVA